MSHIEDQPAGVLQVTSTPTSSRSRSLLDGLPASDFGLTWLAAAAGVLYAVFFLLHVHAIITATWQDSDVAMPALIAHMLDVGTPVGTAVAGNRPLIEEILGMTVTGWIPGHREIWLLAPLVWDVVGLALLGWGADRAFGRSAAVISVVTAACLGQAGRQYFLAWNFHGLQEFHAIVLLSALIYATRFERPFASRRVWVGAVALGIIDAFPVASDELFIFTGLVPLLGAALMLSVLRPGRASLQLLLIAGVVCGMAFGLGEWTASIMASKGFTHLAFPLTVVWLKDLGHNASLLAQSLTSLAGGDFLGVDPDGRGPLSVLRGCLALAAMGIAVLYALRVVLRLLIRDRGAQAPRVLYTWFWTLTLGTGLAVFLFTTVPEDFKSGRYLLAPWVAMAALVGAASELRTRLVLWLVCATVIAFALLGAVQIPHTATNLETLGRAPGPAAATQLARYAASEHVTIGYTTYWDSVSLTWESRFKIHLGAVDPCTLGSQNEFCPPPIAVSGWYADTPDTRSMLIIDPNAPWTTNAYPTGVNWLASFHANLGTPVASATVAGMHVYIYNYDIATKFPSYLGLYSQYIGH